MKLRVLMVEDDPDIRWSLGADCRDAGCEVFEAATLAAGRAALAQEPDLILLDLALPDGDGQTLLTEALQRHPGQMVIVMSGHATLERAVEMMAQGAFHVLRKPFTHDLLVSLLGRVRELSTLRYTAARIREGQPGLVPAQGEAMRQVESQVSLLAPTVAKILLRGPSGSGKTFYARQIHELSGRRGNFVDANCAAIAPSLIETELFGHEKGAFTDARHLKRGVFEQADGGTLLLDEIGDMPLELQAKLLKVVEDKAITRVGAEKAIPVDVRLICATHRDLEALVRQGTFREDLYFRLNVGVITLPSLKERGYEDFLALAEATLAVFAKENNRRFQGIDPKAAELLYLYPWGGNVRELRNVLERIVIFENGEMLTPEMVRRHLQLRTDALAESVSQASGFIAREPWPTVESLKLDYYRFIVELHDGNLSRAAKVLGVSRKTLERERSAGRV